VDIFFDFRPVHGNTALADELRTYALAQASGGRPFLRLLAAAVEELRPPIGLFGGIRTEAGRADLKLGGLFSITAGARLIALKCGLTDIATPDRLRKAAAAKALAEVDAEALASAHETLMGEILAQQMIDRDSGRPASNKVDISRLGRARRRRLREALAQVETIRVAVRDALTGGV
jgi:DNA polymerase-3 subunit epsilon/CBS domain-containing protein